MAPLEFLIGSTARSQAKCSISMFSLGEEFTVLATVIRDAYTQCDAQYIADALEDLCSPNDNYGWASAGVYCFWNIQSHQPLYIGLAVDLGTRFKQHNGLIPCPADGCKLEKIREHFRTNQQLGYSVLVQSPLDQPIIARNVGNLRNNPNPNMDESIELVEAGRDRIVLAEGALIEACVRQTGARPPWNRIGGSLEGQRRARIEDYEFVRWLVAQIHPSFIARQTLRQLSADPVHEGFEEDLHAARMRVMIQGLAWDRAVDWLASLGGMNAWRVNEMRNSGYLAQPAPFE